jgi:NACalpha-BTF3-like transcription factor
MMPGVDPRQMAMMMRKMGIQMQDIEDVQEVVVRTATKEYRIRKATVSIMKAQGTETWQIQGKAEVTELGGAAGAAGGTGRESSTVSPSRPSPNPGPSSAPSAATPAAPPQSTKPAPPAEVTIPDGDIRLVMEQTGKPHALCLKTLQETQGDIAAAIVKLDG